VSDDAAAAWREDRRAASAAHADALARRLAAESARASAMIAEWVEAALVDGPPPVPLVARSYDGRRRFRTPLQGWYLRRDESVAIDTAGRFYVLRTPGGLGAMLRGVEPVPQDPPLVIGAGGKDGESLDLDLALARVRGA